MHPMVLLLCLALLALLLLYQYYSASHHRRIIPISVNFHFSRKCNYECGFCFHTAKTSHLPSLPDAKKALILLKNEGMRKLNFAGGEPFLYPQFLGELARFSKEELKLESVSIVTNGSKVNERFLFKYHTFIDIIAVSCDSFIEETNKRIGRGTGNHLASVRNVAELCKKYNVRFKINTVVNKFNFEEDMNKEIQELAPFRWKCFQVLIVQGENNQYATPEALRDASDFMITDEEFQRFCDAHSHNKFFVPEPNRLMASSYLILDEYLRFVDRGSPTKPILEIGVQQALHDAKWDESGFKERGGIYDWSKDAASKKGEETCNGLERKDLDW
ncbi:hypothetical protein EV426DRAFT_585124 [Tirmania nivea]|nr:hypothetical protein EV426DRAFT_585124 [Tirmania nivea]